MNVAVVGGGLAGAALAWRLSRRGVRVTLFTGGSGRRWTDATGASGGLVRGFEPDPAAAAVAAESLAEFRRDAVLRSWAGYQELTSTYVLAADSDPDRAEAAVSAVDGILPGSATLRPAAGLAPFRGLPDGALAVVELHAGYISPARLRNSLVADAVAAGAELCHVPVAGARPDPAVVLADGTVRRCDNLVLAVGAWTPRLLDEWGLPGQRLRTKQIQYTLGRAAPPGLGAFVDDTSGLYGRPVSAGLFLLGLPSDRWQIDPADVAADPALARRVTIRAAERLGLGAWPGAAARTVAALDCYPAGRGGLRLRAAMPGSPVFTFTGGSGGAAKTALLAARRAAAELVG
ncbi:glycine/D-amino acid oxidase-like deaminating enzyme [Streptomyces sp. V4I8]